MDCEKFDKISLELLYDELDELTSAAAKRHMDHCSRCGTLGARMRATREVGVLPIIEPPADLAQKILRMEREARQALPVRERVGRAISVLAGYAMRPQLAMAALLLLMIGSSFLFLRAKPGDADNVRVTERGIREADESVAIVPLPEQPTGPSTDDESAPLAARARSEAEPRAGAAPDPRAPVEVEAEDADAAQSSEQDAFETAMSAYRRGEYAAAQQQFESIAAEGGEQAPSARLFAAHSARNGSGCAEAALKFDEVHRQFPGSGVSQEAAWQAASCYRALGQVERAREHYQRLLDAPAYADRAQHALSRLDRQTSDQVASRAAAPPTKAKAETTSNTSKPAASKAGTSVPRPSAPKNTTGF